MFLIETKEGKNLHLTHIEDRPFIAGINGTREAIYFLQSLRDMLSGNLPKRPVKISTKYDGAPAIICGNNPENGKFFVGTKSVFASSPKLNYTDKDIDTNHPGEGLNIKLKYALKYLKTLKIAPNRVLQGDMMFIDKDIKTEIIGGEECYTFQPNTIKYAVPTNTNLGNQIKQAKIGIIFHTEYKGPSLPEMKSSFNPHIGGLTQSKEVWFKDAEFTDATGAATFSQEETTTINSILSEIGTIFQGLTPGFMNRLSENEYLNLPLMTFVNSKVRAGQQITNPQTFVTEFITWLEAKFNKEALSFKTLEKKQKVEKSKQTTISFFRTYRPQFIAIITLHNLLAKAKEMIITKLNNVRDIGTFIETPNGYKVTNPEGFVGVNQSNQAIKLVSRLEFSHNNFTVQKSWTK